MHGRTVTVLQHNGKVFAVDTSCFHQGGPLGTEGDIEDINGVACIRCPWHGFRVSIMLLQPFKPLLQLVSHKTNKCTSFQVNLATGGHVQTDLTGQVCEQHGKQRTHSVYDGGDGYYWQVSPSLQNSPQQSHPYTVI